MNCERADAKALHLYSWEILDRMWISDCTLVSCDRALGAVAVPTAQPHHNLGDAVGLRRRCHIDGPEAILHTSTRCGSRTVTLSESDTQSVCQITRQLAHT